MDDDLGGATQVDTASAFDDTALSLIDVEPIGDITDTGINVLQTADDDAPTNTRARRVTAAYGEWPLTPPSRR